MRTSYLDNTEYQNIILRLQEIQQQKDELKNMSTYNSYNAHIKLPGTFEELIINLKRENDIFLEQIKLEKKKLINSQGIKNKQDKDYISNLIDLIINSIKEGCYTIKNDDTLFDSKDLQHFYNSIKILVSKLEANELLLSQIYDLQKEYEDLMLKKASFEKKGFFEKIASSIHHKR